MALESELLGAHALGVRNILALTGDPPRIGDYPTGTGVWDVDSVGLIGILSRLNRGEDQAGKPIGQRAGFTIACALDPTADDVDDREGPARAQARGRRPPGDDPADLLRRAVETMLMRGRAGAWPGGLPRAVLLGILPLETTPPRRVPAQRGARDHDPRRGARGDGRGR